MVLTTVGMLMFAALNEDSSQVRVMISIVIEGTGIGLFSSPNTSAIMTAIDSPKIQRCIGVPESCADVGRAERDRDFHRDRSIHDVLAGVRAGPVGCD